MSIHEQGHPYKKKKKKKKKIVIVCELLFLVKKRVCVCQEE